MTRRRPTVGDHVPTQVREGLERIRAELKIPADFPPDVLAAAERAAGRPTLPDEDLTDLPFETIDPPGARDLDQAMYLTREQDGYRVYYAIADVAAFVAPGDPIDLEAHARGVTYYAPDRRTPLHPPTLSEGAASLLPGQVRPAHVWSIGLDADGVATGAEVRRARVRSVAMHTYAEVQQALAAQAASESLALLADIGPLRQRVERDRGGVSLPVPEQEVDTAHGTWTLTYRAQLPVEGWNEQISLLTGIAAADIMLKGKVGILRTLPPAGDGALERLRRTAQALQISWPQRVGYPEFVRSLDPDRPRHAAMLMACTRLFRGAGYTAFHGEAPEHERAEHAALATTYAHCTAPLRRLVDRYALEVCTALCAGRPVPDWAVNALDELPQQMDRAAHGASQYEAAIIDLLEACRLQPRVGEQVDGVVVEVDDDKSSGTLVVEESAVEAPIEGPHLPLGHRVTAVVQEADPAHRRVRFALADTSSDGLPDRAGPDRTTTAVSDRE